VLPHNAFVTVPTMLIVTLVPAQPSVAVGAVKVQATPQSTTRLVAQVRTGGVVSSTTTVWLQETVLLLQSLAVQVRVTL
jgi:hypothetical protein